MPNKITLYTMIKIIALLLVFSLEILCAQLAFETISEIESGLYYILVLGNILPAVLLMTRKREHLAATAILVIALAIIPYQLYLGQRLLGLKEEAANMTAHIYEYRLHNQDFPQDLSGYTYQDQRLQKFFSYDKEGAGTFSLQYYVSTPDTSHYYRSELKSWNYYPD